MNSFFRYLTEPSRDRWEFTVRLAMTATVTTFLVMYYQTPEPALTTYLVFFLNKQDRASSVIAQIVMLALFSSILCFVFFISMWVLDSPILRVASMAVLSVTLLFFGSSSKLKPVAGSIALITGYLLDLIGSAHESEMVVRGLLYAWLMMAIPAGVSLIINLLIAPAPIDLARRKIEARFDLAKEFICNPSPAVRTNVEAMLLEGNQSINQWILLAAREFSCTSIERDEIEQLASSSFELLTLLSLIPENATPESRRLRALLIELLDHLENRGSGRFHVDLEKLSGFTFLYVLATKILFCIQAISENRTSYKESRSSKKDYFFQPDAFTNPEHILFALRTTGAAMLCYFTYTILDWPEIHTCFITCYIVSLATAGESIEKLRLRITGCLIGALVGTAIMIWLIPYTTDIEGLLAIVFSGSILAGWVAAGSRRIGYAGYQIAFAFYLCVLQGSSPDFDLSVARDRVIGVLLGNCVAYLFLAGLWPVSIGRRLDQKVVDLYRSLARLCSDSVENKWGKSGPAFFSSISNLRLDIELARNEPLTIRPENTQLMLRDKILYESCMIGRELLLLENQKEKYEVLKDLEGIAEESGLRLNTINPPQSLDLPRYDCDFEASHQNPGPFTSFKDFVELTRSLKPLFTEGSHA